MEQVKEKTDCKEMVSINTEKQEKTKRIKYIDIARGIAILSVIIGHVCSNKNGWVRAMLYSFHLIYHSKWYVLSRKKLWKNYKKYTFKIDITLCNMCIGCRPIRMH